MKLPPNQKFKWNYTALSFLLPFSIMMLVYFITSVTPFGSYTLLYSDNFHQYYPFFRQFRQALRSGDSLLWTWSVGMGMDYLGMISYYLASPLNLLSVLLPENWVLTYFTMLMPIKLGLASGFFAIMLKKLFGSDDLSLPLFGSFYAMCAWALGYQWNIMWLDTFALLPLVALGTILLLRDRKYLLYTITLTLAVAANYYVGFFICIFVFLLFWCYEICRFKSIGRLFANLMIIGFFTVLALGMTTILELPALAALQDTHSSVNQFPDYFDLNIVSSQAETAAREAWNAYKTAKESGEATFFLWKDAMLASLPPIFDAMRQVAGQVGGGQTPTYIDGLPNLYCGVFPLALAVLFLLSNDVKLRDKLCSIFLLLLFSLSFIIRQLDYIWHGFHFTNQIPYRFSFLFSFVVLYMAYRAWLLRSTFPLWKIITAGAATILLLLLGGHDGNDYLYWLFNFLFIGLYLLCMILSHSHFSMLYRALSAPQQEDPPQAQLHMIHRDDTLKRRNKACGIIAGAMALELVLHAALFFSGFSIADYDYPKGENAAAELFQKMNEQDDGFYRAEVTHAQTLNDGALNGYNGISTFSSSANVATTQFTTCLGAAGYNSWNRYCYEEGTPVANLFLNLKYLVERDNTTDGNAYFDVVLQENGLTLLQNNAYLPLGFLANAELAETEFNINNHSFTFQNQLFRQATGLTKSIWSTISSTPFTLTSDGDITINQQNIAGHIGFSTGSSGGTLTYTYEIGKEGYFCLDLNLYKHKNFSVWHNGQLVFNETFSLSQMLGVEDVQPGDVVEVKIKCAPNHSSTSVSVRAAILNEELFRQGYEILNASTLQLTEFSNTYLAGTIDCNRDGLLYTSIPQDGNWVAYVDGNEAEITLIGDCMVGLMLTEGPHDIEFRYENKAFQLGARISATCALVFIAFTVTEHLLRKRKSK
ncbi:MAG: YfhO family protein [Oscillospiraceae bacterium]|nr:YfhO family protein [Oscillospiraceae bacterium]